MPIEFRCSECNKLLRTGDDTVGRQAKCPECGAIMDIPSPGTQPVGPPAPAPPQDAPSGPDAPGSPFGAGSPGPSSPFGTPGGMGGPPPSDPTNPYQSPASYADVPIGYAVKGPIVPTIIDMGDIFSHTWDILKERFLPCLGAVFVVIIISNGTQQLLSFMAGMAGAAAGDHAIAVTLSVVAWFLGAAISIWIGIGQAMFLLKVARGEEAPFGTIFAGGPYFLTVLLASMLFGLIVCCGYLLLIVPGVIFALMYSQFYYLIIDRDMGVMESLETSKQIMVGNKLILFATYLLAVLGGLAVCILTCFIGIFAVAPYWMLMGAVIYLLVTGQPTARHAYGVPFQSPAGLE